MPLVETFLLRARRSRSIPLRLLLLLGFSSGCCLISYRAIQGYKWTLHHVTDLLVVLYRRGDFVGYIDSLWVCPLHQRYKGFPVGVLLRWGYLLHYIRATRERAGRHRFCCPLSPLVVCTCNSIYPYSG